MDNDRAPNRLIEEPWLIQAWAIDFVRAMWERPLWARLVLRLVLGKYAYREFIGLIGAMWAVGLDPDLGYNLENAEYNLNPNPDPWAWRDLWGSQVENENER